MDAITEARRLAASGRFDDFIDMSVTRFTELYQGPWREYTELVGGISPTVLEDYPEITVISSAASSWFAPHTSLGWARVEKAVSMMRHRAETQQDARHRMRSAGIELGAFRILSRTANAAEAARRWETALQDLSPDSVLASAEMIHVIGVQAVGAYAQHGDFAEAARALSHLREDDNVWRRLHAESMAAMAMALYGDMPAARRLVESTASLVAGAPWAGSYNAVGSLIATALLAIEDGDGLEAHRILDRLDDRVNSVDHWPFILVARGRALRLTHSPGEGVDILQELAREHRGRRAGDFGVNLLRATIGDLLAASGHTEHARSLLDREDGPNPGTLSLARLILRQDPAEARRRVRALSASHHLSPRMKTEALLLQAIATARLGMPHHARTLIERAASLIDRKGNYSTLALSPRQDLVALLPTTSRISEALANLPADGDDHGASVIPVLTPSETRVLHGFLNQASARTLAANLYLSPNTVKTHLRNIYRKLGAKDRESALSVALKHGLLD